MEVNLKNIGKKYEGREEFTLKDIDLRIESKDFCVILGPSGCGKTTLLRMIAGLNSITEGDLYFNDKRINKTPPKDRDISMVFQSYALYPHMTVYENMAFSLVMRKKNKKIIHERVIETAKLLELSDYLYSKPSDISGGQRQRVALGRAIVRKPKVFLMDEPLSNLDAKLREHMRVELVRLHKALGSTTVYVTHDQIEAMTMATKIVLMNDGKIQQVGKPEEFYNKPANMFVAKFIGSPNMNIIEGNINNGKFEAKDGIINVRPSEKDQKALKDYEGKKVYLGIRAERFESGGQLGDTFECTIDVVEMLGKEKTLYTRLESGHELVISVPGYYEYNGGERHSFGYDIDALHFFDSETKERIN
ncbi:sn-glycerol-3-phosphate ABC transporter ATP-binding protein UgpC [Clostridium sp. D2Q-14]|uniref:ABC transporter ATP-binding protein n=1 Tax=Anaeromonas gelatinilytica TaxID=2683194 RepID=UPI00193B328C|nr:sn-glycerol-3-phosphate ABC transporter ATP-binding protein UgpC [Anaeromonas gelatinilytica]MBS4535514.1 sn-glycerol-3-phosphate ABC transporter ATP-binding protein UgpC [Anaeromonas gelatinilytica]